MSVDKFNNFTKWYEANKNTPFCLREQLGEYCQNDTNILLKAILAMRRILLDITNGYDVLPTVVSIAGAAMSVYTRCYLQPNTIALISEGGYEKWAKASDKSLKMMSWIAKTRNIDVQHAGNGREHRIGKYKVDGYIAASNTVIEFMGCYYHSHPACTDPDDAAPNGSLNRINYMATTKRLNEIRNQWYNVEVFWECEVDEMIKDNQEMREFFQDFETEGSIGTRMLYILRNNVYF